MLSISVVIAATLFPNRDCRRARSTAEQIFATDFSLSRQWDLLEELFIL
jgi:hypothetical protein